MMRDSWTDRLSEYVDGDLDAPTRAQLEAHLATCTDCQAVVTDLRRVVERARHVGYREPTTDLWQPIESTIQRGRGRHRRLVTISWARLATAAAIVAVLAGGFAWTVASRRVPIEVVADTTRGSAGPALTLPPAPTAVTSAALTVASDRDAAADLERILEAGRSALRPETMRIIEDNLRAIDLAIAQTDSALARDPGSAYLNEYLASTVQRKLRLLRRAVQITGARS